MRSLFFALVVLVAACNDKGGATNGVGGHDLGGSGGSICPNHPANCDGTCCGTTCTSTMLDPMNCGACGTVCTQGQVCVGGHCGCLPMGAPCATGQTCCPNAGCADLTTDIRNCGMCGHSCGDGSTCTGGICRCGTTTCTGSQVCCGGTCADNCQTTPPDMAMSTTGTTGGTTGGLPPCDCTGLVLIPVVNDQCPLFHQCVAMDCCAEDTVGLGNINCVATPSVCAPSQTPQ